MLSCWVFTHSFIHSLNSYWMPSQAAAPARLAGIADWCSFPKWATDFWTVVRWLVPHSKTSRGRVRTSPESFQIPALSSVPSPFLTLLYSASHSNHHPLITSYAPSALQRLRCQDDNDVIRLFAHESALWQAVKRMSNTREEKRANLSAHSKIAGS